MYQAISGRTNDLTFARGTRYRYRFSWQRWCKKVGSCRKLSSVCFCGRLDTEIMVSVKDHCCNFMQFKVTVIGNVIEYLPICWPIYYPQYGANINYHKFRLLHWPKWHFFAYLLRLNLHFAGIMSPASSNMDVGTGESSKLKTFSTFRVSFVRLSTWVMCLLLLRN